METQEKRSNSMLLSLDSLPKDILDKLKDYKFIQDERERKDDTEVEDCFRSKSCEIPTTPRSRENVETPKSVQYSPSTPRLKKSESLIFRYPPVIQDMSYDKHGGISPRRYTDRGTSSPSHSEPDHCHLYGDNSDWMMIERLKPRSPPVSPDMSSRSSICSSVTDSQRISVLNRSPESCFVRPPSSPRLETYRQQQQRVDRTPQKRCFSPKNRFEQQEFLERTPVKLSTIPPEPLTLPVRSMTGSIHKIESNTDQLSPGYYAREMVNRSPPVRRIPDYPGDYVDERRSVRKQLVFDGNQRRSEEVFGHCEQFSPRSSHKRFDYGEDDDLAERLRDPKSSALLSQLLGQLSRRKRKTSERSECDCDCDERSVKKRRTELKRQMNLNYLKQLEADVNVLNSQLRKSELETRPENCSCAIMERQFLQMAENAYKNIRRHDTSADGFAQFRKELTETNQILKESLTVLNNMKEFCEHKTLLGLS